MGYGDGTYRSTSYNKSWDDYGYYNFVIEGFARIRNHFSNSVKPVIVYKKDGEEDIGTCFLVGNNYTVITARHVLVENAKIFIPENKEGSPLWASEILVPKDESIDLAFITSISPLNAQPFKVTVCEILDEVLCLGYPPIPGFQSIQIAETLSVNSFLRSSGGAVVASSTRYIDSQTSILINNPIKGGNSGGPIINNKGFVVGICVDTPLQKKDKDNFVGSKFGVALPSQTLTKFLKKNSTNKSTNDDLGLRALPFENTPEGIQLL